MDCQMIKRSLIIVYAIEASPYTVHGSFKFILIAKNWQYKSL